MQNIAKIFLLFLLATTSCQSIFHNKNDYEKLRDHKVSMALRDIFDFYSTINCHDAVTRKAAHAFDKKKWMMMREKFFVLDIKDNDGDDTYEIHVAIAPKGHPDKIRIWYFMLMESDIEKSGYEIIKFDEYPFQSLEGRKWPFDAEHLLYWL